MRYCLSSGTWLIWPIDFGPNTKNINFPAGDKLMARSNNIGHVIPSSGVPKKRKPKTQKLFKAWHSLAKLYLYFIFVIRGGILFSVTYLKDEASWKGGSTTFLIYFWIFVMLLLLLYFIYFFCLVLFSRAIHYAFDYCLVLEWKFVLLRV